MTSGPTPVAGAGSSIDTTERGSTGAPGSERTALFLALHGGDRPLIVPNAWDPGSAALLESLGFDAVATTSSGVAGSNGRLDHALDRDRVMNAVSAIAAATTLPVTADLENGYGDDPGAVADCVGVAGRSGLAGCSIEDYTGTAEDPIYPLTLATERIAAAGEAARGAARVVLTARAENHVHGIDELDDTIRRLQAYEEAGADVLFAPGLTRLSDIARLVEAVDRPVNVLLRPGGPTVDELAGVGVARISVGGAFYFAAMDAVASAATDLRDRGGTSPAFLVHAVAGASAMARALRR